MVVTSAGLVRQHGPMSSCCSGSRQPPVVGTTTSTSPASGQQTLSPGGAIVEDLVSCLSLPPKSTVKFLKCFLRASRDQAGKKQAAILDGCQQERPRLLGAPPPFQHSLLQTFLKRGHHWSLASAVNIQLREEADPPPSLQSRPARSLIEDDLVKHLAAQVWRRGTSRGQSGWLAQMIQLLQ